MEDRLASGMVCSRSAQYPKGERDVDVGFCHIDRALGSRVDHLVHVGRIHPYPLGHRGRARTRSHHQRPTSIIFAPPA